MTRNRNDFFRCTIEFARLGWPHAGVLIALRSNPATRPEPLAHALRRWRERMALRREGRLLDPYFLDFLAAQSDQ